MLIRKAKYSKSCWHLFRILILILVLLVCGIIWVEFPIQLEAHRNDLLLQKQLDQLQVKLSECSSQKFDRVLEDRSMMKVTKENKPIFAEPEKYKFKSFEGAKLVHLDLKGAPPRMNYLLKLLPLFKEMGATGLLMEYEDMFPYHGAIEVISSQNAYSYDEIRSLLAAAKEWKLEVVPLVQTLGHFEFVLKHEQFRHLRETPEYPNMPCPLHKETKELIRKMIDQVLELHTEIKRVHLGGDEVFNIKDCEKCKASGKSKDRLFISYMLPLLKYVLTKTGHNVKPIIWDDMLRKWSVEDLKELSPFTEVMVWGYVPELDSYSLLPDDMWDRYAQAFEKIWIASSFKGAIAASNNLVPIPMHLKNHESWIRKIKKIKNKIFGVAITGWARYDHFATLCELLPQGIPSLALSLSILKEGSFKLRLKDSVQTQLGFKNEIMLEKDIFGSWDTSIPDYPGGDVYALAAELENHVSWYKSTKDRFDSWGSGRHIRENKISLYQINAVVNTLKQLLPSFQGFREKCKNVLKTYFYEDAVAEWISDKVDSNIELSQQLYDKVNQAVLKLKSEVKNET